MTEQQVREIVRDELSPEKPYRGGWFKAWLSSATCPVRRWRDPKTGIVWDSPKKTMKRNSADNFDFVYKGVQWEDDAPVRQEWPPAGLPVLVQWAGDTDMWVYAESNGGGRFRESPDALYVHVHAWKYAPANWDNAPEECTQWIVASTGEQEWVRNEYEVGDAYYPDCTVVHVEGRP